MALCLAREGRWVGLLSYEALTLDCTLRRARRARMSSRSDWGRDKTESTRMSSL